MSDTPLKKLKSLKKSQTSSAATSSTPSQSETIASLIGTDVDASIVKSEKSASQSTSSGFGGATFKPKINVTRKKKGFSEDVVEPVVKKETRSEKNKRPLNGNRFQKGMHQSEGGLFSQGPALPSASARPGSARLTGSEIVSARNNGDDILIDTVPSDLSSSDDDSMKDFIVYDNEESTMANVAKSWKPITFTTKSKTTQRAVKEEDAAVKVKEEPLDGLSSSSSKDEMIPDENSMTSSSSVLVKDENDLDVKFDHKGLNKQLLGHQLLIDSTAQKSNLMFFQLPAVLPVLSDQNQGQNDTKPPPLRSFKQNKPNGLPEIPSGQIGSFLIMKSGKMVMEIGGIMFNVASKPQMTSGINSPSQFICVIDPTPSDGNASGNLAILGECNDQLVCTPDISTLML